MNQKIRCNGCGSEWEIDNDGLNDVAAHLLECPLCVPKDEIVEKQ